MSNFIPERQQAADKKHDNYVLLNCEKDKNFIFKESLIA